MFTWVGKLVSWVLSLWTSLPESNKDGEKYFYASSIIKRTGKCLAKELIASPLIQLSSTEASKFGHKVSELAASAEVIAELSDEIGVPTSHETEDEFVERAKLTMKRILKRKLSK